jgi:hypothetical protein
MWLTAGSFPQYQQRGDASIWEAQSKMVNRFIDQRTHAERIDEVSKTSF